MAAIGHATPMKGKLMVQTVQSASGVEYTCVNEPKAFVCDPSGARMKIFGMNFRHNLVNNRFRETPC